MKEITILDKIEKLVERMPYRSATIKITTRDKTYTLGMDKDAEVMGFTAPEMSKCKGGRKPK